jgi:hypothetical protein
MRQMLPHLSFFNDLFAETPDILPQNSLVPEIHGQACDELRMWELGLWRLTEVSSVISLLKRGLWSNKGRNFRYFASEG